MVGIPHLFSELTLFQLDSLCKGQCLYDIMPSVDNIYILYIKKKGVLEWDVTMLIEAACREPQMLLLELLLNLFSALNRLIELNCVLFAIVMISVPSIPPTTFSYKAGVTNAISLDSGPSLALVASGASVTFIDPQKGSPKKAPLLIFCPIHPTIVKVLVWCTSVLFPCKSFTYSLGKCGVSHTRRAPLDSVRTGVSSWIEKESSHAAQPTLYRKLKLASF